MFFPPLLQAGEIVHVVVRNLKEEPKHATGKGKERLGLLGGRFSDDVWYVLCSTGKPEYANGEPRIRIPPELWEADGVIPPSFRNPGYVWSNRAAYVPTKDIIEHMGFAPLELRVFFSNIITNLPDDVRQGFLDGKTVTTGMAHPPAGKATRMGAAGVQGSGQGPS